MEPSLTPKEDAEEWNWDTGEVQDGKKRKDSQCAQGAYSMNIQEKGD